MPFAVKPSDVRVTTAQAASGQPGVKPTTGGRTFEIISLPRLGNNISPSFFDGLSIKTLHSWTWKKLCIAGNQLLWLLSQIFCCRLCGKKEAKKAENVHEKPPSQIKEPQTPLPAPAKPAETPKSRRSTSKFGKTNLLPPFINKNNLCWMHASLQCYAALKHVFAKSLKEAPEGHPTLDALRVIEQGIATRDISLIDQGSTMMHAALIDPKNKNKNIDAAIDPYNSQDAATLFEVLFADLNYSFNQLAVRRWKNESGEHEDVESRPMHVLHFIVKNPDIADFQQLIDEHFAPTENTGDWEHNGEMINTWTETCQLGRPSDEPPPALIVQYQIFESKVPKAELQKLQEEREQKIAIKLSESAENLGEIAYEPQFISQIQHQYPAPNPDWRKSNKSFNFPSNFKVDFSKAFGKRPGEVVYRVVGVINHSDKYGGHYTADVRYIDPSSGREKWFHTDDMSRTVQHISRHEVNVKSGYLFAFERCLESSPRSSSPPLNRRLFV